MIDLQAYFSRIRYEGSTEPTLETLRNLHYAHVTAIPFENLNPWTNRRVSLELADIEAKLVGAHRGGYCFECNALFAAVLRQLGYEVTTLIARVCWNQPPEVVTGRTHMILRVEIDGQSWIADVGFGGLGQTAPLLLGTAAVQPTSHEPRRYSEKNGIITHQVGLGPDRWDDLYRFDLSEAFPIDYELGNWYTSTHPQSIFRNTLMVTLPREDHRLILAFGEFTCRWLDGRVEKRAIADDADLRGLLVREFGLSAEDAAVTEATLSPPV